MLKITFLGQVCFLFETKTKRILVDPYFSNSVARIEDSRHKRQVPVPGENMSRNIDYVLITHQHRDHCDVDTLLPLYEGESICM